MHPRAILARNLKRLRRLNGLSQEALAHDAGLDRTYVSDLEREVYAASVDTLAALAAVFNVTASQLIDKDYEPGGTSNKS
jgi:transcriptional regulator with XRE-family HTH domain